MAARRTMRGWLPGGFSITNELDSRLGEVISSIPPFVAGKAERHVAVRRTAANQAADGARVNLKTLGAAESTLPLAAGTAELGSSEPASPPDSRTGRRCRSKSLRRGKLPRPNRWTRYHRVRSPHSIAMTIADGPGVRWAPCSGKQLPVFPGWRRMATRPRVRAPISPRTCPRHGLIARSRWHLCAGSIAGWLAAWLSYA